MSKFDEIVDEVIYHAKNAADVASRKTGEVVGAGKVKYQIKQLDWDIEKTYAKLGAIVYEAKKSKDNLDEIINLAVQELDELNSKKNELEEKLLSYRKALKCTNCGQENELAASFCSRCGTTLIVSSPNDDDDDQSDVFF